MVKRILNKSEVRNIAKGLNVSDKYIDELEKEVEYMIENSIARARKNSRNTLMMRDV